jgi:flagellar basal-body rod modification protein FlgD
MSIPTAVKPLPVIGNTSNVDIAATKAAASAKQSSDQKDMFLKLLVAQLQNQDPSAPMDQKDMMAQMTQFSQVEQMTNMVTAMNNLSSTTSLSQSVSLIGKNVTYGALGPDGTTQILKTAKVKGVTNGATGITLQLDNDKSILSTDVKQVTEATAAP